MTKKRLFSIAAIPLIFAFAYPAFAQNIDPFYAKLLRDGENLFLAGKFSEAVRVLEIAVFGLSSDARLAGKAHIYLSLGYADINDKEKSRQNLARAARLLGQGGFSPLSLQDKVVDAVRKIEAAYGIRFGEPQLTSPAPVLKPAFTASPPAAKASLPVPTGPRQSFSLGEEGLQALESRLKADPGSVPIGLELTELYIRLGRLEQAEMTLGEIQESSPEDPLAEYLSAKILFQRKRYKPALEGFHKLSSPACESLFDLDTGRKVLLYITVCLDKLGQKRTVPGFVVRVSQSIPPEVLVRLLGEEGLAEEWRILATRRRD